MVAIKLLPFAFVVLFLAGIVGIVLHYKFLVLLKEEHFEKWKELGSPTLLKNNSIKTNLAIFSFLKNKKYLEMNDPKLIKISMFLWNYSVIYLIFFIVALFIFAIGLKNR